MHNSQQQIKIINKIKIASAKIMIITKAVIYILDAIWEPFSCGSFGPSFKQLHEVRKLKHQEITGWAER